MTRVCHLLVYVSFVQLSLSECIADSIGTWTPPCPWTGPYPVKHWSFDTLNGLTLMEGTIQTTFNALTNGKVNDKTCSVEEWEDKRKYVSRSLKK